jgi:preprotein translocase subunit YajC
MASVDSQLRQNGNSQGIPMTSLVATAIPTADHWLLPAAQATGGLVAFLPLVVIMVIFYVLLIMPAQRRQKKTQAMLGALKNGDKIVTNGGLYGTIVGLEDDAVQLRVAENVKVKVARSAIAGLQPGEEKPQE